MRKSGPIRESCYAVNRLKIGSKSLDGCKSPCQTALPLMLIC